MDDAAVGESAKNIAVTSADVPLALLIPEIARTASDRVDWLLDNAATYSRLLETLRGAPRSGHIAHLSFDADCAAYSGGSLAAPAAVGRGGGDTRRAKTTGPACPVEAGDGSGAFEGGWAFVAAATTDTTFARPVVAASVELADERELEPA